MFNKSLTKLTHELIKDINAHPRDMILIVSSMRLAYLAGQKEILNEMGRRTRRVTK